MQLTPENEKVTRADIHNLLEVNTPLPQLKQILLDRGMSQLEVDKIVSDLNSYN